MTAELMKEKDSASAANEVLLKKVEKLSTENGEFGLENATLKVKYWCCMLLECCWFLFVCLL